MTAQRRCVPWDSPAARRFGGIVAFRSAKAAWGDRYFRGAKGDKRLRWPKIPLDGRPQIVYTYVHILVACALAGRRWFAV